MTSALCVFDRSPPPPKRRLRQRQHLPKQPRLDNDKSMFRSLSGQDGAPQVQSTRSRAEHDWTRCPSIREDVVAVIAGRHCRGADGDQLGWGRRPLRTWAPFESYQSAQHGRICKTKSCSITLGAKSGACSQ